MYLYIDSQLNGWEKYLDINRQRCKDTLRFILTYFVIYLKGCLFLSIQICIIQKRRRWRLRWKRWVYCHSKYRKPKKCPKNCRSLSSENSWGKILGFIPSDCLLSCRDFLCRPYPCCEAHVAFPHAVAQFHASQLWSAPCEEQPSCQVLPPSLFPVNLPARNQLLAPPQWACLLPSPPLVRCRLL